MSQFYNTFFGPLAMLSTSIPLFQERFQSFMQADKSDLLARYEDDKRRKQVNEKGLESLSTGTEDVRVIGSTAIVPVGNVITKGYDFMTWWYDGTSADMVRFACGVLGESDNIDNVILHIDSPGGSVNGVALAADSIRELRTKKNVVAVADDYMCSAAYWLGSAASQVLVNPSSVVGSIGVFAQITNYARLLEELKIDIEIIRAGKFKAMPNAVEPLDDTGRALVQNDINYHYRMFVEAISLNRNITMEEATNLADGTVSNGAEAIEANLADGEGTIDQTVDQMTAQQPRSSVFGFLKNSIMGSQKSVPVATVEPTDDDNDDPGDDDSQEQSAQASDDSRFAALEAQIAQLQAANQNLNVQIQNQNAALADERFGAMEDRNVRFVEGLINSGRMRAAAGPGFLATLNALVRLDASEQEIAFVVHGEEKKTTMFAFLQEQLSASTPIVSLGEEIAPATGDSAEAMATDQEVTRESVNDLKAKALAYQKAEAEAGRTVSNHAALQHVLNNG